MTAGRELDALVAERVMGLKHGKDFGAWPEHEWKRNHDGDVDIFGFDADTHNGPACTRCHYGYCHHCQKEPSEPCEVRPRQYSTDIAAAWEVAERMRTFSDTLSFALELRDNSEHRGPAEWLARFDRYTAEPDELIPGSWWTGETAPLAICRAALKALDYE